MKSKMTATLVALAFATLPPMPPPVQAHCDSLNGPVVTDARLALERHDPAPALKWVRPEDEREIRELFKQALAVRKAGPEARELADRFFFENLVRIHRAAEGETYTGLKAADDIDPGILAADQALERGTISGLAEEVSGAVKDAMNKKYELVLERKKHAAHSIEAGREFVTAYVDYIHFVENARKLTAHGGGHHGVKSGHHAQHQG